MRKMHALPQDTRICGGARNGVRLAEMGQGQGQGQHGHVENTALPASTSF
jgi:hypothetical protein